MLSLSLATALAGALAQAWSPVSLASAALLTGLLLLDDLGQIGFPGSRPGHRTHFAVTESLLLIVMLVLNLTAGVLALVR